MTATVNEIKQTLKPNFCHPYLTFLLQNSISVKGLYDTGADISCISGKTFRQLTPDQWPTKMKDMTSTRFKTAGG